MWLSNKLFYRYVSFLTLLIFTFTTLCTSTAFAESNQPVKTELKKSLVADIGEIPDKLPKTKIELTSKRTKYSTRYLNPDGSFTEEIYIEPQFYQDPVDKKWKKIDNSLKASHKNSDKAPVDVTANPEFSQSSNPVLIDSVINEYDVAKDTFVASAHPDIAYYTDVSMRTGYTISFGSTRSFMQFYMPALPSGSRISSASIDAYQTKQDATTVSVDLYRITSSWTSYVTWNTQPTIGTSAESTVTSNTNNTYWQWNTTQLVKDWYNGVLSNFGVMLKQQNEGTTPYRTFSTSNNGTNTPRLTINYWVEPFGIEDFWSYTKDGVNPASGNLVLQDTDFSIPGRGVPVSVSRTYNSRNSLAAGIFGYGWRSNIETCLVDAGTGPITLIDSDYTRHIFGQAVGGGYVAAGGVYLTLVKNADSTYTVTQTDGSKVNFNTSGKVSSIVDTNNNTTSFAYTSGKLSSVTDASGRTTSITYGTNGYVSSITDPANRTIGYEYDTNGNLTKVTDAEGKFVTFDYDTSHNLTTITDERSTTTTIAYDTTEDKVTSVSRPITIDSTVQTSTTTYSYDTTNCVTTVVDGENRRVDYTYNPNGNVEQITENPLDANNKAITTFDYDNNNNLTQIKDPNTNKVSGTDAYIYTYDSNGNITGVQLPEGQSATYTYDSRNNMTQEEDFNSNTSNFIFDTENNNTEATDPNIQTSAMRYDSRGNLLNSTYQMSAADNLLANSSFEADANSDNWPDNWTQAVESGKTATFTWSTTAKYGSRSMSISNPTGWAIASSAMIPYTAGDKYIVSGYAKTTSITNTSVIKLDFFDSSNNWLGQHAAYELRGTHDWTRIQAVVDSAPANTTQVRVSVGLNAGTGTVYYDGLQLEKWTMLSAYNLVDNSSFERDTDSDGIPDNWTTSGLTTGDGLDQTEKYADSKSFKINGQSGVNKYIKQRINFSGDANTKLTLSGWSKQSGANPNGGYYLIQVGLNDANGNTFSWSNSNNFDKTAEGWQHVAAKVIASQAFSSIDVYYYYYNQTGTAWFDAMRLETAPAFTSMTYDTNGNYVTSVKDPYDNTVSYAYSSAGNVTDVTDAKNKTTSFVYDDRNLLTQVTDAKDGITTYGYDNAGNRTTVTNARNKTTTYAYNEFNKVSSITDPLSQSIQFGSDKNGNSTKLIFPKGDTISYTYNALNRMDGVYYNAVQKWGYTYDANGNVTNVNDIVAGKTTDYTYDKNNRITRIDEGASNSFDYAYDYNSNLTTLTATAGATTVTTGYSYDTLNQMTALLRNSSNIAKFIYDERGNMISSKRSNGTYTAYEYDSNNCLTSLKNYNAAGALLESYSYTYDANGNRTSVVTSTGTISYQYDDLNQLTQETLLDSTTISYEYDVAGNRTKKTVGANITNYTYDDANQLTAVNGQAYTYDANGNLTGTGAKTFVYDELNQLKQVKDSGGNVIASFTYDDKGRRNSMTVSGVTTYFHYSGDKVVYETDSNNNITAEYTYDSKGNPVTMTKNGVTYYYHANGHGDIIALTDASGATMAQYQYDAWGNILSQSGTMALANPYRYAGYRYDEVTGLYYLMARYYDAGVGRFITNVINLREDPLKLRL